ncbi:MAG: 50S ribosomal protein L33 [Legionellales bacterium]|jgi:large subunit ribosomal protein L33|nr:50S ribosomal protein L33 [Legionellales bacterium]|tara:strand:- start:1979 stop:2146 length:168 start_codon:yes stop_codon:yes gene_type:complete
MAMHGKRILVKLVNKATGSYYVTVKNPKNTTDKLRLKKYDRKTRKIEEFVEDKIK